MTGVHVLGLAFAGIAFLAGVVALGVFADSFQDGHGRVLVEVCDDIYADRTGYVRTAAGEWVYREAPQSFRRLHGAELEMLESCEIGRGPGG